MAYYYVKDGESAGTAGGTTKKTGAFSSLASTVTWGSIQSAIDDGGAGDGDIICVSDEHEFINSGHNTYTGPNATGDILIVVSVDDTAVEDYKKAVTVQEHSDAGSSQLYKGRITHYGMYYQADESHYSLNTDDSQQKFYNCTINVQNANKQSGTSGQDCIMEFYNCAFVSTTMYWTPQGGSVLRFIGGSTNSTRFLSNPNTNGGANVYCKGFDISSVTTNIVNNTGSAYNDGRFTVILDGCKLNASTAWANEEFSNVGMELIATRCSSSSDAAEYQFYTERYGGNVEDETTIYRDESTAWPDGGEKTSLVCVTDSNPGAARPFWFYFPTRYAELSNTASDKIRIYLASTATLYDSDVWVEVLYPDDTTKQLYNFISTQHDNVLDTNGTALTTDSGSDWKDGAGDFSGNEYYIDIDTSSDAGADCAPIIRVYVAKASTTVYFCPTLGLS